MKDIVFFSKYREDVNSPKLLSLLKLLPAAKSLCYYCIDRDPVTKKRNDDLLALFEVTAVPTLIIAGETFVGEDAFAWVNQQLGVSRPPPAANSYIQNQVLQQQRLQQLRGHPHQLAASAAPKVVSDSDITNPLPELNLMGLGDDIGGGAGLSASNSGGDFMYANPNVMTDVTGINASGADTTSTAADGMLKPIQTKDTKGMDRLNETLQKYEKERSQLSDAMFGARRI
ncbi:hypothetical protein HDU81_009679 [Chytriomyces hyalinus]|nr:hypothetical protein HDU81_009679 [Chytriomyces hyalinus]